jgi:hypothetical protein
MPNNYIIVNGELYHYGVPGMKWGVRKAKKLLYKAEKARAKQEAALAKGKTRKADRFGERADEYQGQANRMAKSGYISSGRLAGASDYYRDKAKKAYDEHDANARTLDKTASKLESEGKYIRAEATRKAAAALRARGANVRDGYLETANDYLSQSKVFEKYANEFTSKTNIDLGKKAIDSIISDNKSTGYKIASSNEYHKQEKKLKEAIGDDAYDVYKWVRGK